MRNFCSSDDGSSTKRTRTCLLYGLIGGGKTQSCVALTEDIEKDSLNELSTSGKYIDLMQFTHASIIGVLI